MPSKHHMLLLFSIHLSGLFFDRGTTFAQNTKGHSRSVNFQGLMYFVDVEVTETGKHNIASKLETLIRGTITKVNLSALKV
jgi:hypothetical protein